LKIHYLEESLRKSAPDYHQAALKENTELKVDKVTMQRELAKTRKLLNQAEHDLEKYRLGLQDMEERKRRSNEDKALKEERDSLRERCNHQQLEIDGLLKRLESHNDNENIVKELREEIEDLQANLRERDREIEAREEEFDEKADQARGKIADLEERLGQAEDQDEELQELHETIADLKQEVERMKQEAQDAREECEEARNEQQKAEDDLNEVLFFYVTGRDENSMLTFVSYAMRCQTNHLQLKV
jgi:chromosome segregation ATPase